MSPVQPAARHTLQQELEWGWDASGHLCHLPFCPYSSVPQLRDSSGPLPGPHPWEKKPLPWAAAHTALSSGSGRSLLHETFHLWKRIAPWGFKIQLKVARAQLKRFSNTRALWFTVNASRHPKEMELGEIVVAERPGERQLYAEQKPRAQDLLGRSRNCIHQVFEYLTGEMKEYGEWMKSEWKDVLGALWLERASWEHPYCQQYFQCWGTRRGAISSLRQSRGGTVQAHCKLLVFSPKSFYPREGDLTASPCHYHGCRHNSAQAKHIFYT